MTDRAGQAKASTGELAGRVLAATPEPVAAPGRRAAAAVRSYPIPAILGTAVVAVLVCQIVRRRR